MRGARRARHRARVLPHQQRRARASTRSYEDAPAAARCATPACGSRSARTTRRTSAPRSAASTRSPPSAWASATDELREITRTALEAAFSRKRSSSLNSPDARWQGRRLPLTSVSTEEGASFVSKRCSGCSPSGAASPRWPCGVAACGSRRQQRQQRRAAAAATPAQSGEADQGRPRHRHRRPQRPLVQRARQQGPQRRAEASSASTGRVLHLQVERRLRAEPLDAGAAEVRPRSSASAS